MNNDKFLEKYKRLEAEKSNLIFLWQEISEFIYPQCSNFTRYYKTQGQKRRRIIYDSSAELALDVAVSGFLGLTANPTTKFIGFKAPKEIEDDVAVKAHIEEAREFVLDVFLNPKTGFYSNLTSAIKKWLAFGTVPVLCQEDKEIVAKFCCDSPKGLNFTEDFTGEVDEIYLEREISVQALMIKVEAEGWAMPEGVKGKKPEEKESIVRCLYKNPDYDFTKEGRLGAEYISKYYQKTTGKILKEDFFYTCPIVVGRYERLDNEKWGDCPARMALADIKVLNLSERFMTIAMERRLNPTLFFSNEAKLATLRLGQANVINGDPNRAVRELQIGNTQEPFVWQEQKRDLIRKYFFNDLFQMADASNIQNVNNGVAFLFNQERLRVLAPKVMKFQSEVIGKLAERVYDIGVRQGKLKIPRALAKAELKVTYTSPVMQAQRNDEANSIMQYLSDMNQIIASFGQIDPQKAANLIKILDEDKMARELADIRGVSVGLLREEEVVQGEKQQEQQAQQMQSSISTLQDGANVAKTINEINQMQ